MRNSITQRSAFEDSRSMDLGSSVDPSQFIAEQEEEEELVAKGARTA